MDEPLQFSADHLLQLGPGRIDAIRQLGRIEATHGMLHDQEPRFHLPRLGLRQDEWTERIGGDHVGRDAALCQFDAVVETPR